MLRRLFIGLLILSALTSEGAALLAFNTIGSLNPGYGFNQLEGQSIPDSTVADSNEKGFLGTPVCFYGNSIVPLEDILRAHAGVNQANFPGIADAHDQYGLLWHYAIHSPFDTYNRNIVIKSSDLSPPAIA